MIHKAGYLYCDLKLENILINLNDKLPSQPHLIEDPMRDLFDGISLNLIDFGLASTYIDPMTG